MHEGQPRARSVEALRPSQTATAREATGAIGDRGGGTNVEGYSRNDILRELAVREDIDE